jgi:hypothetical protein
VITALGHGSAVTSSHWVNTSCIRAYQGSEIHGVPASDIRAMFFHSLSNSIILSDFVFPECEWYEVLVAFIS